MTHTSGHAWRILTIAACLTGFTACGDSNGNPMGPSGGGGGQGQSGATITIGANGAVSPAQVTINAGQSVTVINNDSRGHQIASDPHPSHTNCPPINALTIVGAGQTKLTGTFATAGSCGFHDHDDPNNPALRGTITIR